jgi:hypothetical protein
VNVGRRRYEVGGSRRRLGRDFSCDLAADLFAVGGLLFLRAAGARNLLLADLPFAVFGEVGHFSSFYQTGRLFGSVRRAMP